METTPANGPIKLYEDAQGSYALYRVGADIGGESVLLVSGGDAALIDAGYAWCAPQTYRNIQAVLGDEPVGMLLLTHSHYDHAAGAGYLKKRMSEMVICAHAHAARVFERPGALATMRKLNDAEAHAQGLSEYEDVSDIRVDRVLEPGETVRIGMLALQVIEAPGHTRDSLAFLDKEYRLLISCESAGVYAGPLPEGVVPGGKLADDTTVPEDVVFCCQIPALTGYADCLAYIERAQALDPAVMLVPHSGVMVGQEVRDYLAAAAFWGAYEGDLVVRLHNHGLSPDAILECFKRVFYTEAVRAVQPEPAFDLNASYTVPLILRERV